MLWDLQDTLAQKWLRLDVESGKSLENKIVSIADAAIKAGFPQIKDSDF